MFPKLHNKRTMSINCAFSTSMSNLGVTLWTLCRITKNKDISNPFKVTERKTHAVENIVDKNKYLTILFLSQHFTYLDTCPKYHPCVINHQDKVLEGCRTSYRVIAVKIVLSDNVWTIVSAYAPQVGC